VGTPSSRDARFFDRNVAEGKFDEVNLPGRRKLYFKEGFPARRTKAQRMATAHTRIRWDRLGRWALLFVLALVLYLYIGPTKNWVSTWREAGEKRQEVATLREENERLRVRRAALKRESSLEREARRLGMVKAGERMYIVEGLPKPAR
jgi:cell division protein FtsB